MNGVSMRPFVNPLRAVPVNRFGMGHDRLISYPPRSLLLQSCIISRRRRDSGRRRTCRRKRSPAAEKHNRSHGRACVKSFHIVPPGLFFPARSRRCRHRRLTQIRRRSLPFQGKCDLSAGSVAAAPPITRHQLVMCVVTRLIEHGVQGGGDVRGRVGREKEVRRCAGLKISFRPLF